ncbi:SSI family serine proteinase inhibitor [Halostreptopolyspora alba]|uniref:Subtilisin inhibitor domain-containing protein n=1 Tax=Halostreptopolyspora alba TaxID=2487137 RepID=A0A3N0EI90_9ACTN|nr:hypothetical protein EFW17_01640 [Nocardiopsaceae bacterium YIM 96095]
MRNPRSIALLAAVPAMLFGLAAPATADDSGAADRPGASYTFLMYKDKNITDEAQDIVGDPKKVTLECLPAGGSHPAPEEACAALEKVGGQFERLPTEPEPCPMYWDPVTVVAEGYGFGHEVEFREGYSNEVCASAMSDGVFRFG